MTMGDRIRKLREAAGMTQDELARKVGYKSPSSRSSIQKIESGQSGIPSSKIDIFAETLETTRDYLMGWGEPQITDDIVTFEVIGDIAAGYKGEAVEEYTGIEIDIPREWLRGRPKSDYFMLKVKGDSMYPAYQEGDYMAFKRSAVRSRLSPPNKKGRKCLKIQALAVFYYPHQKYTKKQKNTVLLQPLLQPFLRSENGYFSSSIFAFLNTS